MSEITEFKEYTRCSNDRSSVWQHFLRSSDGQKAQCKICKKILKTSGTTTSLRNHITIVHKICLASVSNNVSSTSRSQSTIPNTEDGRMFNEDHAPNTKRAKKINDFFRAINEDKLETTIAKMTALDGLSFRVFCTSESMRKLFEKAGHKNLPKSPHTIKSIVMANSDQLKKEVKMQLHELQNKGQKFAVSLDEWTSARNRRYINVNIHSPELDKGFINLGLARIIGSGTAANCCNLLKEKLVQYGLLIDKHIACVVTDGASVMCALGRMIPSYHQQCLAHGIQCAVLDVLYKKNTADTNAITIPNDDESSNDDDSDVDDSNESSGFSVSADSTNNARGIHEIVHKELISKVRKVVKYFKVSPTRTECLNKYLTSPNTKELSLVLDCKTRWSSLADMITRFLKLKEPVLKALIDLKDSTTFTEDEIRLLQVLSDSLNIIKATVEELCTHKANLLTAEVVLKFMIDKLNEQKDTTSGQLVEELSRRIQERRNANLVSALKYLHNPAKFYDESESVRSLTFRNSSNQAIFDTILHINKTFFCEDVGNINWSDEEDDIALINLRRNQQNLAEAELKKSVKEQLKLKVLETLTDTAALTSTRSLIQNGDLETILKVEMAQFDRGGPRAVHLAQAYQFLLAIPPTSVESERVFSANRMFCGHLRCSFNDKTLDALSFLRFYYLNKK